MLASRYKNDDGRSQVVLFRHLRRDSDNVDNYLRHHLSNQTQGIGDLHWSTGTIFVTGGAEHAATWWSTQRNNLQIFSGGIKAASLDDFHSL